jgi:hypothetical protein
MFLEAFLVGNQGWPMKGQMLRYSRSIFRFIQPVHVHLKTDKHKYGKNMAWNGHKMVIYEEHSFQNSLIFNALET